VLARLARIARSTPTRPGDVYVWVADLAALQEELQSKGARIMRGPEDTFYHTREIEIEDCNGYVICFGQDTSG